MFFLLGDFSRLLHCSAMFPSRGKDSLFVEGAHCVASRYQSFSWATFFKCRGWFICGLSITYSHARLLRTFFCRPEAQFLLVYILRLFFLMFPSWLGRMFSSTPAQMVAGSLRWVLFFKWENLTWLITYFSWSFFALAPSSLGNMGYNFFFSTSICLFAPFWVAVRP